jgi:anti-anti-sigma factor
MSHGATRRTLSERQHKQRFARPPNPGDDEATKASETARRVGASCYLELERSDGVARLVLVGELDVSCEERFLAALYEAIDDSPKNVAIDLRSLTFIDSTGIALLLKANGIARAHGADMHVVRSPADIVRAVFEATGVGKLLPPCDEPPRVDD